MASNTIFSGASRYATDFTQIIDRAVAIASLPLTQLGNQRAQLTDQSSAIATLSAKVGALRSAAAAIGNATGASSYAVANSNGAATSPAITGEAFSGTYEIEVVSTGVRANTSSVDTLPTVADPNLASISTSSSFTLTVGGASFSINPTANTLTALAAAINETTAAGVQAVVVNLGSVSQPDYRLSLQSRKLGPVDVQLNDGSQDLLTAVTTGAFATYRINGLPAGTPIDSDTATGVPVAPGLTVDLLKAGSSTITVSRSSDKLSEAFSTFARAYNDLAGDLDKQRGESGGALSGQSVVSELTSSLRRLSAFTSKGSLKTLTDLGFTFDDKGVLSFNSAVLTDVAEPSLSGVLEFLGSSAGEGFLGSVERILDGLDTESTGLISAATDSVRRQIESTDALILANQERIDLMRESLAARISAADALIAAMEQQVAYMTGLLEATRINVESSR
jgi:flagellar hook-associated protein 2